MQNSNERWYYINKQGEKVFKTDFLDAWSFSEGLAAVKFDNNRWGYINMQGEKVFNKTPDKHELT